VVIFSLADTTCESSDEMLEEWRDCDGLLDNCDWGFVEV
jgi:hypothetical protein